VTPRINSRIFEYVPIENNHGALLCKSDGIQIMTFCKKIKRLIYLKIIFFSLLDSEIVPDINPGGDSL
jgi:hypothetical protein